MRSPSRPNPRRWWRGLRPSRRLVILLSLLPLIPTSGLLADLLQKDPSAPDLRDLLAAAPAPACDRPFALCIDGPQFMAALRQDLTSASDQVLVQTLSFEADPAGLALAQGLLESPARDRRLLIDDYSRVVVSDKVVGAPNRLFDPELAREAEQTRTLITELRAHGVDVRYGRPLGLDGLSRQPRDHKKLVVIDDKIAYIGGINFSEHNFRWHDLMLRAEIPQAAAYLAADFERSWRAEASSASGEFGSLEVSCSAGEGHPLIAETVAREIRRAEKSLVLQCPYVTEPFLSLLGEARRRGVAVTILTSERSNRFCMKQNIMDAARTHDLELRLMPGPMTHVKALLIDDRSLVLGSANFDFLSATLQPEVVAVVRDTALVDDFRQRVLAPDLAGSRVWLPQETSPAVTAVGAEVIALAGELLQTIYE